MSNRPKKVECTIPVLRVTDLKRSIEFYTQTLGFKLDWGGEEGASICSVSRDGCSLMLSVDMGSAAPGCVWIGLEDASLFDELRGKGVEVRQEPKNFSWAYEMKFADPDGNVLWLGAASRTDLPRVDQPTV